MPPLFHGFLPVAIKSIPSLDVGRDDGVARAIMYPVESKNPIECSNKNEINTAIAVK